MSAQAGSQIRRKKARLKMGSEQSTRVLVALVSCLLTRSAFDKERVAKLVELSPRQIDRELRTLRRALLAEGNRPTWQGIARVEAMLGRGLRFGAEPGRAVSYTATNNVFDGGT